VIGEIQGFLGERVQIGKLPIFAAATRVLQHASNDAVGTAAVLDDLLQIVLGDQAAVSRARSVAEPTAIPMSASGSTVRGSATPWCGYYALSGLGRFTMTRFKVVSAAEAGYWPSRRRRSLAGEEPNPS
jgi:hypothetical protein